MKKNYKVCIGLLFIIVLCMLTVMPMGKALVWISPMKMLAEGNITDSGFCKVEKAIILKNDGNDSVFVTLNLTGIEVIFEENPVELKPGERITIYPVVIVKEGKHTGTIVITGYDNNFETGGVGAKVVSSMAITVTTLGHKINSSAKLPEVNVIGILIALGGSAAVVGFFMMKKKRASMVVQKQFKCPSCHTKVTTSGKPGDTVKIICRNCGKKGKVTIPMSTKPTSSKRLSTKQVVS